MKRSRIARFVQLRDGRRQFTVIDIPEDMADVHAVATPMVSSPLHALPTAFPGLTKVGNFDSRYLHVSTLQENAS